MPRAQTLTAPVRAKPRVAITVRTAVIAPAPVLKRAPARIPRPSIFAGVFGSPDIELLRTAVRGSRTALACPCGAEALRIECTRKESARFGGERFARAFACSGCGKRYVGRARPA
jgi:hypothetical protein